MRLDYYQQATHFMCVTSYPAGLYVYYISRSFKPVSHTSPCAYIYVLCHKELIVQASRRQVNEKFYKLERVYRDCIKIMKSTWKVHNPRVIILLMCVITSLDKVRRE